MTMFRFLRTVSFTSLLGLSLLTGAAACDSKKESTEDADDGDKKPKAEAKNDDAKPWCDHCECKKGKIDSSAKKLQRCELKKAATIQGMKAKAGKKVVFNKEGWLTRFTAASDTELSGVVCRGGGEVELASPGKLRSCHTKKTAEIDGVKCTGGISLHRKSGKLSRCKLASAKTFGPLSMPKGSWITLYPSGKPERFEVPSGIEVQGHKCKGYMNYLYESGKLKKCKLAEEAEIDGKKYDAKAVVCFDEAGKVRECKGLSFRMTG